MWLTLIGKEERNIEVYKLKTEKDRKIQNEKDIALLWTTKDLKMVQHGKWRIYLDLDYTKQN